MKCGSAIYIFCIYFVYVSYITETIYFVKTHKIRCLKLEQND